MILFLCILLACTKGTIFDSGRASSGVLLSGAEYRLGWKEPANSFEFNRFFENNLGYQIELSTAWMVHYSLRLYPCPRSSRRIPGISLASAGHSDIAVPSNWSNSWAENLLSYSEIEDSVEFAEHRVCDLVYTIARSDASTKGMPEEIDLEQKTLLIEGRWSKGREAEAFVWETALPSESVYSLEGLHYNGERAIRVELLRDRGHLFDDIEFEDMESERASVQLFSNLMQNMEIQIEFFE